MSVQKSVAAAVACVALVGAGTASAVDLSAWGPVKEKRGPVKQAGSKKFIVKDASEVDLKYAARGGHSWDITLKVPKRSKTVKVTRILRDEHPLLNRGKSFPVARVTTTTKFTVLRRAYTERIPATNVDRYWNVCVNEGKEVWMKGGVAYCTVQHKNRVRVERKSKIKNFRRPVVIAEQDLGIVEPDCAVGARKTTPGYSKTDPIHECRDGVAERRADGEPYTRNVSVTAKIWHMKKKRYVTSTTVEAVDTEGGPGWVRIGEQPLPAPTATVTGWTRNDYSWTVTGTYSCSYRSKYDCPMTMEVQFSDGSWKTAWNISRNPTWSENVYTAGPGVTPTAAIRFS